jgi:altronate dehydratase
VKDVLVISDRDNVATALVPLSAGQVLPIGNGTLVAASSIPRGHKIAVRAIAAGESVVKYGSSIGIASAAIPAGAHVHTHNLASARGRGDLAVEERSTAEGRLAEPPDDRVSGADAGGNVESFESGAARRRAR